MKTHTMIISAIILTALSGVSLAETGIPVAKPATAAVDSATPKTITDAAKGVKAVDEAAVKVNAAKDAVEDTPATAKQATEAAKQTLQDIVTTEDKPKAAEAVTPKTHLDVKANENTAKATKHSAEKALAKVK